MDSTIITALSAQNPSIRLRAVLAAGTVPDPALVDPLIDRGAGERDFYVRDMLTWAVTRHPDRIVVPKLIRQLGDSRPGARSFALHTLSKVRVPGIWEQLPVHLLHDASTEVRTAAWRAAVAVVPQREQGVLVDELRQELGRGDWETQRSLSRALAALAGTSRPELLAVSAHASATLALIDDPDSDFLSDLELARRLAAAGTEADN
ncbi:HEAT repeat domain-containing protein [Corynebacterium pacaense]|uniref:HEAT repeat domain-containing protein n=1 Tax=Corynebacterium pacaense TaxID=1816684 RepID=UPI0009BB737C|nr:hypothetical protein [Corynebacterium pacaense]